MSLTFLTDHTAPRQRELDEHVLRLWHRRRPELPVTLAVRDHEELKQDLERYLVGEHPPDVMTWFAGNQMRSLVDRGLMLDTTGLWRSADIADGYAPRFRAGGGSRFHVPTSQYWWAMFYRPSVFRSLGIGTPVRTWPELTAAAEALLSAGIAPFALGARHDCPAAAWFDYLNLRLNGPAFHQDLMALTASYTDERVRGVFDFWQRLLDAGWFLGTPTDYDEEAAVTAVTRGAAGMTLAGAYILDEYVPEDDPDLDFFRFPVIDPTLPVGEDAPTDGYVAAGKSDRPDAALAFLAHLASREVQQATIESLRVLPTRDDVDVTRAGPHVAHGMTLLRQADAVFQFYDLDTPWEVAEAGMRAFHGFLAAPGQLGAELAAVEARRRELRGA